jgi:hypothetical protein
MTKRTPTAARPIMHGVSLFVTTTAVSLLLGLLCGDPLIRWP